MQFFKKQLILDRESEELYLERWILIKSRFLCVYFHKFHQEDYDLHHDHPWSFLSFLIRGRYWEYRLLEWTEHEYRELKTLRKPFSIIFRKATDLHRVVLDKSGPKPISLFISGPRTREWGFVEEEEGRLYWVESDEYLKRKLHQRYGREPGQLIH